MKSAVEWLESEIRKYLQTNSVMNYDSFKDLFAKAKEHEIGFLQAEFQFGYEQAIDDMKEVEDDQN
jgi:predicted transcriptional regulator